MIKRIYCVFDKKDGHFQHPMMFDSDVLASRAFSQILQHDEIIKAYPSDFCVYYLGTFNTSDGVFLQDDMKVIILEAASVIEA